jgi:hypothetical protein
MNYIGKTLPICRRHELWFAARRLRELHTLKGHVESVVKLKGLDINTIQHNYTV